MPPSRCRKLYLRSKKVVIVITSDPLENSVALGRIVWSISNRNEFLSQKLFFK